MEDEPPITARPSTERHGAWSAPCTRGDQRAGLSRRRARHRALVPLLPAGRRLPPDGRRPGTNVREYIEFITRRVRHIGTPDEAGEQIERLWKQSDGGSASTPLAHDWAAPDRKWRSFELRTPRDAGVSGAGRQHPRAAERRGRPAGDGGATWRPSPSIEKYQAELKRSHEEISSAAHRSFSAGGNEPGVRIGNDPFFVAYRGRLRIGGRSNDSARLPTDGAVGSRPGPSRWPPLSTPAPVRRPGQGPSLQSDIAAVPSSRRCGPKPWPALPAWSAASTAGGDEAPRRLLLCPQPAKATAASQRTQR